MTCGRFFSVVAAMSALTAAAVDFEPVRALAARVDPRLAKALNIEEIVSDEEIATVGPTENGLGICLRASSPSAACLGLGRYIRDVAKGQISWCGNAIPPYWLVPEETRVYRPSVPVRFAYNYCTLSYTAAFWTRREWREEIDRLALSGFNVALVLNGLTKVWRDTLMSSGRFTEAQVEAFMTDDAARAWWHMGNLAGLGGPVTYAQSEADAELGRWIYAEMKKLGIEPAVQAWVGFLPPSSNVDGAIRQGDWCAMPRPDILNPLSYSFDSFASDWYSSIKRVYGTAEAGLPHYLCGDLFHEGGRPGGFTRRELAKMSARIQALQKLHIGPSVTWVLQSWQGTPVQGIRDGLDPARSLVQYLDKDMSATGPVGFECNKEWLDANGELHKAPIPWIWCEVLNFGGNPGLHGGGKRFFDLRAVAGDGPASSSFRGYGMLSEGLGTNAAMYDLMIDAFADSPEVDAPQEGVGRFDDWARTYMVRRYGVYDESIVKAFRIMFDTVWGCSRCQEGCTESVFCAFPSFSVDNVSAWGPKGGTGYDPKRLREAGECLLKAMKVHPRLEEVQTFRFDFCELFLQILSDYGRQINAGCASSSETRREFLAIVDLADALLACSPPWRFNVAEAPARAAGEAGVRGYRRMITNWTGDFDSGAKTGLRDYAHRLYSGLLKGYYSRRWQWFFNVADGMMEQSAYVDRLRRLDEAFMSGQVVCEPSQARPLPEIGEEIISATASSVRKQ
ncbi:MAG: alpha-N-acetylglucosaminidase [Lentisphaerae bacterium]|nr:alpha-N-acetylglucosaminidase [Lentisphaerota bacterium]